VTKASIHEAGHAVILLALGRPFAQVTKSAVRFDLGHLDNDLPTIHLAGVAAEVIAGGDGAGAWARAAKDGQEALRLAPTGEEMKTAWAWTLGTLRRHWAAVEAIAGLLDAQGEVDYSTARAIFEQDKT
jgi:hypothetical protein